jgi:hypothetical protein
MHEARAELEVSMIIVSHVTFIIEFKYLVSRIINPGVVLITPLVIG